MFMMLGSSLLVFIYTIFVLSVDDASEDSGFKYSTFRISPLILGTDSFDSSRAGLFKYLSALSLELFELKKDSAFRMLFYVLGMEDE